MPYFGLDLNIIQILYFNKIFSEDNIFQLLFLYIFCYCCVLDLQVTMLNLFLSITKVIIKTMILSIKNKTKTHSKLVKIDSNELFNRNITKSYRKLLNLIMPYFVLQKLYPRDHKN